MSDILETVLLLALPASGKSEVRRYLKHVDAERCRKDFHLGPTVQLDDFPYVHMMRQTDGALRALGKAPVFFHADDRPFQDLRDWGTLIELINEDYDDLVGRRTINAPSAGHWLLDRFIAARRKAGASANLASVTVLHAVADRLEREARELLNDKLANYPETLNGKTLVIEFARGGPQGAAMPLGDALGYRAAIGRLSAPILDRAAILYVWVTPEESRRKNTARTDPNDPGSILHHGVPMEVMLNDYGCDDMAHLIETSHASGHIDIDAHGKHRHLPVARFDNRIDKTSFVREEPARWRTDDVSALHTGLQQALTELWERRR